MGLMILGFLMYAVPAYLMDDWGNPYSESSNRDFYQDGDYPQF